MLQVNVEKNKILSEDIEFGIGEVTQSRGGASFTGTKVNTADMPYSASQTLSEKLNEVDTQYNYIIANVESDPSAVPMAGLIRKSGEDLIDVAGDVFTPQVVDEATDESASYVKKLWVQIISGTEHHLKRGADIIAKFNPVDHSQIFSFDYSAIATAVALLFGTAATKDAGTGAGEVLLLADADTLPALDGSNLTGLPTPDLSSIVQVPIGGVIMWPAPVESIPANFMLCDGSALNRVTYAALFAVYGEIHGAGDGSTTFQIPEYRGEFIRGFDNGRGIDTGRSLGDSQADAFQGHQHRYQTGANNGLTTGAFQGNTAYSPKTSGYYSDGVNGTPRTAAETRPRNVSCNFILRYE